MKSTPKEIRNLLNRCKDILTCIKEQRNNGYLGQIQIEARKLQPKNTQLFVIEQLPFSQYHISTEEGLIWGLYPLRHLHRNQIPLRELSVQEVLELMEEILFQIYSTTGFGHLTIKCWYFSVKAEHKFELLWYPSHRCVVSCNFRK